MTKSLAALLVLGLLATPAAAQTFPSRTITIVSPAPPGGSGTTILIVTAD